MKQFFASLLLAGSLLACRQKTAEPHAHEGEEGLQAVSYTLYTDKSELFIEFKPLVVGNTSRFAAHLTKLGESFLPFTEGSVTVTLIMGNKGLKNTASSPASPGI